MNAPVFPNSINDIGHVIQLAIAPVFLLNAIGALIGVLVNRLARAVDRTRVLTERLDAGEAAGHAVAVAAELEVLQRRMRLIYLAIVLDVICALFVGLLIVIAFVDSFVELNLARLVALLFVAAMLAFIGSLSVFLREIFLAIALPARQGARAAREAR